MIAKDIMSTKLRTLNVQDSLHVALHTLREFQIRHLPVLEDGELVGIIADRDLKTSLLPIEIFPEAENFIAKQLDSSVSEIMHTDLVTVGPDTELMDLIEEMLFHRIGALLVVDPFNGKLVGIVSYTDVLRAFQREIKQADSAKKVRKTA